ncbi:hypothetical protein Tco_0840619 [Tanacetum coccineum]|uniref:Uncharacterized protein n=1 Tax=Tanacetum coccineum TaxID=301880 RepID=A0ABQ5AWP9_9ASTR
METSKPLIKDVEAEDVDFYLYRSTIRSLMYLTASRSDIMFAVCACARFQVTPKVSHLHDVKRIFRYLKVQPKLGLWYPKDSPFDLEAYTNSDYAGASLDRKSTTGGCQFLERRLISWQCKKQTIVANYTTKAKYVTTASCCGQVLWIQNQMLDYEYNFMNTNISIDNESTICIVKNPVFHLKTKHIEIRHHFIRDSNEKKLIQMIKIHTSHNVADLLTKAFEVARFQYLITTNNEIQVNTVGLPYYTVDNGEQEITSTVDSKEFTITEAFVRRHLQLADVDGISVLPTTKNFDQLALMGYVLTDDKLTFQKAEEGEGLGHPSEPQPPPSTAQPTNEEPIPNVVSSSHQKTQTLRQALNHVIELPQTSEPIPNVPDKVIYEEWDDRVERVTTTAASLDAEQASVESLEANLKQTKKVYGVAYTKLIKKVKKLEKTVKYNQARRRAKIVVSDDEEDLEDSSKQGRMIEEIDQDAGVTLVTPTHSQEDQPKDQLGVFSAAKVLADAAKENVHTYTRRRMAVSTGSGGISTASRLFSTAEESVSIAGASMPVSTAVRLQEELDEKEIQRIARAHEADQSFTEEEWENIRERVEADEELSRRLQAKEMNKYSEVDQAKMLIDLINQRKKYFAA